MNHDDIINYLFDPSADIGTIEISSFDGVTIKLHGKNELSKKAIDYFTKVFDQKTQDRCETIDWTKKVVSPGSGV